MYRMRDNFLRDPLREARGRLGLSQAALAALSGVSRVTIARLESGAAANLRAGTLERLCSALGLELTVVPAGGQLAQERALARERERTRRLERRVWHAQLAVHLGALPRREAAALIRLARAVVDRWQQQRLCSTHYVSRWRKLLDGQVEQVAHSLVDAGDWADALFQNTPWSFARDRLAR
jgi:transcriptional regulator with XRE-family HTH domain